MSKKNENRQFVSASGTANDVVQKLAKAIYGRGGDDDDLRRIISDTSLCSRLADLIVGERPKSELVVTLDPAKTLIQMVEAGKYDSVNSDINEKNFPLPKSEGDGPYRTAPIEISLELVHFDKVMTTHEIEAEMDRRGLRAATLAELLAFGVKYPEFQRQFKIVALGSSWGDPDGYRRVPSLCEVTDGRGLRLSWVTPVDRWRGSASFLVVRK